ncbi:MAG TPA: squalene synthase HpnC [Solirubrobacteraceae bacterium]
MSPRAVKVERGLGKGGKEVAKVERGLGKGGKEVAKVEPGLTQSGEEAVELPLSAEVMAQAGSENFPVASRLLPRRQRRHLLAIYGFARLVDEIGDESSGDREAALRWIAEDLDRAYLGQARHPLLVTLASTVRACGLPREPFERLIEANRRDQRVARYATWSELLGYCELSANPVGELVLGVFGLADAERVGLSDAVCTALQVVEHLQDVAEDLACGRIYLPGEDRERFGVSEAALAAPHASAAVRALIAHEAHRAALLLDTGQALVNTLRGRPRLAVAAFVAGGRAALGAIAAAGYDVLAGPPRASRGALLAALPRTLREARR